MTDTLEIAEWLTRFEKIFGATEVNGVLQDDSRLRDARNLFFNELGYDVTRKQFESLRDARNENVQNEMINNFIRVTGKEYLNAITHKLEFTILHKEIGTNKIIGREGGIALESGKLLKDGLHKQVNYRDMATNLFCKKP